MTILRASLPIRLRVRVLEPDLRAASIRLAVSGVPLVAEDDEEGVMRFLRQRRRTRVVRRAIEVLPAAAAWSPSSRVVVAPINHDRHELGSAARPDREARGWARLDRS